MTGPLRLSSATDDDPARGTGTPGTGPVPGTGTGTRPGGPLAAPDPTGLRYDRADLDDSTPAAVPPGVEGHAITGRLTAPTTAQTKRCCGAVLIGEECDCAEIAEQIRLAPVIVLPAFNLRRLAAEHVTAVEVARHERWAS